MKKRQDNTGFFNQNGQKYASEDQGVKKKSQLEGSENLILYGFKGRGVSKRSNFKTWSRLTRINTRLDVAAANGRNGALQSEFVTLILTRIF